MSGGTFVVPIALPTTAKVPTLSAWDLLPAHGGRPVLIRPSGLDWRWAAGLVLAAALSFRAGAAEVPYLARRGETLRQIADRLWGDPDAWRSLWAVNRDRVRNPGFLTDGTTLRLPDRPGPPGPLPANPLTVRPGDTLWDLAGRIYGDSWAWPVLWGANRDRIRHPHWIYPDQRFRWPSRGSLYVVRPGDTLHAIARAHYGSGEAWPRLWAANRGWLVSPERLPAYSRLWVPP